MIRDSWEAIKQSLATILQPLSFTFCKEKIASKGHIFAVIRRWKGTKSTCKRKQNIYDLISCPSQYRQNSIL